MLSRMWEVWEDEESRGLQVKMDCTQEIHLRPRTVGRSARVSGKVSGRTDCSPSGVFTKRSDSQRRDSKCDRNVVPFAELL